MSADPPVLRRLVAGACGLVAVLYALTGSGLVAVTEDQEPGAIPPLLVGAGLFAVLGLLVARGAGRAVMVAGALLQVPVVLMYLAIAAERTPPYEPWGISIKVLQLFLLGAFGWLAWRGEPRAPGRDAPESVLVR
jgi:hypothetical protein